MSFFDTIKNALASAESEVVSVIGNAGAYQSEIQTGLAWVAHNGPVLAQDFQNAVGVASAFGVTADPAVAAALDVAEVAVGAVTSFASAYNAGKGDIASLVAGYGAVKNAQSAVQASKATSAKAAAPAVAKSPGGR